MLLLTSGSRPASVFYRGGEVRIDIHDATFLRTNGLFLSDLQAYHPDTRFHHTARRKGSLHRNRDYKADRFIRILKAYRNWRGSESRWYAMFGLLPPKGRLLTVRSRATSDDGYRKPGRARGSWFAAGGRST